MIPTHPLRTLAASKLSLLGCIIMSVNILTSTAYSYFEIRPYLSEMIAEYFSYANLSPEQLAQLQKLSESIIPISTVIGLIFGLALSSIPAVALWLVYFSARSSKPEMKSAGFIILNVYLLISVCILGYNLAINIISTIGEGSFYSIVASSLESLMNLAMLIAARKLLIAARNTIKNGKSIIPVSNRCSILIIINLCVAIGTLLLQIFANVYPNPVGQMREYVFSDLPSLITGLTVSVVSIAEFTVFYFLSRKGVSALTCDILPPQENINF